MFEKTTLVSWSLKLFPLYKVQGYDRGRPLSEDFDELETLPVRRVLGQINIRNSCYKFRL